MRRNDKILKNQDFISTLKFALNEFGNEYNVTANTHFANKLHFSTPSQFINTLLPYENKYLRVDELLIILDNLGQHSKHILDFLCNRYGYVCSNKASTLELSNDSIKDLLLQVGANNGLLFSNYLESIQDEELDKSEIKKLKSKAYNLRALLNQFENDLDELL